MSQSEQTFSWETPPELWRGFKVAGSDWRGKVVSLYIAPQAAKPMVGVSEVRAFADRGLEGDRFFGDKSRRNIVTCGVPLVELLDREFTIGNVVMRGIRLFEPCNHLEKVSKIDGIFRALEHRSGLKAAILSDGVIRIGDPVTLREATSALATSSAM